MISRKFLAVLAVSVPMAFSAPAAAASAGGLDVDVIIRVLSDGYWGGDWSRGYYGYGRYDHRWDRVRTQTVVTRGGLVKVLYLRNGRVIDSDIIGRVDHFGRYGFYDRWDRFGRYDHWDRRYRDGIHLRFGSLDRYDRYGRYARDRDWDRWYGNRYDRYDDRWDRYGVRHRRYDDRDHRRYDDRNDRQHDDRRHDDRRDDRNWRFHDDGTIKGYVVPRSGERASPERSERGGSETFRKDRIKPRDRADGIKGRVIEP